MTLDKAIEIYEKCAKLTWNGKPTIAAEECQQMVEWLKDYKRLRETTGDKEKATMHEDCYFCIKRNICTKDVPKPCKYRYTEEERIADQASYIYGAILAGMYLPKTYQKEDEGMTEIIDFLKKYIDGKQNTEKVEISVLQINRVIKALEQEPCDDCISREAALDDSGLGEFHRYDDYVKMRNYLKSLPSVTPQPKMGRWIEHFDQIGKWYECDQCHTDWGGTVNYCPNCGTKMVEPQESEAKE